MRTAILFFSFIFSINMACEAQNPEKIDEQERITAGRHVTPESVSDEASCLEVCGHEARGMMYDSCLETGETQKECGRSARVWYRECLQTRCEESAIQQDDCRTDCRINAKEQKQYCEQDSANEQECNSEIRSVMRTCIDDC